MAKLSDRQCTSAATRAATRMATRMETLKIQLATSPCYPPYAVVIGEQELWDGDCASGSIETTLALAREQYPGAEIIRFDDPRHYSRCDG